MKQEWCFEPIDDTQFPALALARHCGEIGGGLPAIFNAANEIAVAGFIAGKIAFTSIVPLIEAVVAQSEKLAPQRLRDLVDVSAVHNDAQMLAREHLIRLAP